MTAVPLLKIFLKDKSVTIHQHNLQQLAIEIFKVKIGKTLIIINEIFTFSKTIPII